METAGRESPAGKVGVLGGWDRRVLSGVWDSKETPHKRRFKIDREKERQSKSQTEKDKIEKAIH